MRLIETFGATRMQMLELLAERPDLDEADTDANVRGSVLLRYGSREVVAEFTSVVKARRTPRDGAAA